MRRLFTILLFVLMFTFCKESEKASENKSERAILLVEKLKESSKTQMLFGQQDAIAYGVGWRNKKNYSDVKNVIGKHPAMVGFDLSKIGLENKNVENIDFQQMKELIIWYDKIGGITTLSWHMLNPINGKYAWENESLETNIVNELLQNYILKQKYLLQLDAISDFLEDLKDENGDKIPILFRPFHEANGKHFWWSSKFTNPKDYINLWNFTCEYLIHKKNHNQLIMVYCSDVFKSESEYLQFYPKEKFVDILAFSDFHSLEKKENYKIFRKQIKIIENIAHKKNKLFAIAEVGNLNVSLKNYFNDILLKQINKAKTNSFPAYIFTWRNATNNHFHTPFNKKEHLDFRKFSNSKSIKFL